MPLRLFIGFFIFSVPVALSAAEIPISSGRSMAQKADTLMEMLDKDLQFARKQKDQFRFIRQTVESLHRYLAKASGIEKDQVQEYIIALESLPGEKQFRKSKCSQYEVAEKASEYLNALCE